MSDYRTDPALSERDAKLNSMAVEFLERTVNAWMKSGLPLPVLARAMIGMGTSCIEGSQGHAMAADALDTMRNQLAEHRPAPAVVN